MKSPEALRQKADQRLSEIATRRRKAEAAEMKARNQRQIEFINQHRQEWRNRCEQAVEGAADNGRKKTVVRFDPDGPIKGREERKEFAHVLIAEIADELRKQGFRVSLDVHHLPEDHEGPEIYTIILTINWSKPL